MLLPSPYQLIFCDFDSTNLNKIPFKSYTLDLIKTISKTYDKDEKVKIETSIENIESFKPILSIIPEHN